MPQSVPVAQTLLSKTKPHPFTGVGLSLRFYTELRLCTEAFLSVAS